MNGSLTLKRFEMLSGEYESEQEQLERQITELQTAVDTYKSDSDNADRFIKMVKRYTEITGLNATILNEYIERIEVHEADKSSGQRVQDINITFNFIGSFPVPLAKTA